MSAMPCDISTYSEFLTTSQRIRHDLAVSLPNAVASEKNTGYRLDESFTEKCSKIVQLIKDGSTIQRSLSDSALCHRIYTQFLSNGGCLSPRCLNIPAPSDSLSSSSDTYSSTSDFSSSSLTASTTDTSTSKPPITASQLSLPEPPDGGYGWVIVFAAFLVHTITEGVVVSFGIFIEDLVVDFGDSVGATSWVGSFSYGVPALVTPVASLLISRCGCRVTCIVGALISTVGCLAGSFANSLLSLVLSFGILSGLGMSFCTTTALVIVSEYFDDHRATATGLSIAGTGVGALVFPPVVDMLLDKYTWRGTLMLMAGAFLNIAVSGAFMRPVETRLERRHRQRLAWMEHLAREAGLSDLAKSSDYLERDVLGRIKMLHEYLLAPVKAARCCQRVVAVTKGYQDQEREVLTISSNGPKSTFLHSNLQPIPENCVPQDGDITSLHDSISGGRNFIEEPVSFPPVLPQRFVLDQETFLPSMIASRKPDYSSPSIVPESSKGSLRKGERNQKPVMKPRTIPISGPYVENVKDISAAGDKSEEESKEDHKKLKTTLILGMVTHKNPHLKEGCLDRENLLSANSQTSTDRTSFSETWSQDDVFHRGPLMHALGLNHAPRCLALSLPDLSQIHRKRNQYSESSTCFSSDESSDDEGCFCLRKREYSSSTQNEESSSIVSLSKLKRCVRDCSRFVTNISKRMCDFKLFRRTNFVLFLLSNFLLYFWYNVTYFFMGMRALSLGMLDTAAALLFSILGGANMVGEIVVGLLADRESVDVLVVYFILVASCGLSTTLVPLFRTFLPLSLYMAVFGIGMAANDALCTIILVEFVGLHHLTTGLGMCFFCQGAANILGPPAIGYVIDSTQSLSLAFVISGLGLLFSAAAVVPNIIQRFRRRRARLLRRKALEERERQETTVQCVLP
ncbi:unnamed protein product [Calicophoron daubneyi]|uniref:Monocarboxylate transporter 12 n=1 Tax=Calicophoron daubneyi TaxID=300641 RepID=A0AAV2T4J7_CALDB